MVQSGELMFKKKKKQNEINVENAVAQISKYLQEDKEFAALLGGVMMQSVVAMKAMTKAWITDMKQNDEPAEKIAAVSTLLDMRVAREVRKLVGKY
jgi:hypothetical protein